MKKLKLSIIILGLLFFICKLTILPVYAGSVYPTPTPVYTPVPESPETAKEEQTRFNTVIGGVYNLLYPVAILYGILQIIFAGYKIMRSEGEPKAMSDAKEHLTSSIVGVIFVILAVVILRIVIKVFLGQDVTS